MVDQLPSRGQKSAKIRNLCLEGLLMQIHRDKERQSVVRVLSYPDSYKESGAWNSGTTHRKGVSIAEPN